MHDEEWSMRNLGRVQDPTVRWIHRQFWLNALPVLDSATSLGKPDGKVQLLDPRLFYVSGYEGRMGVSISRNVEHGQRAARKLYSDYIAYHR